MTDPQRPAWLADLQRPPARVPANATRPAPILLDGMHRPIETADAWRARRAEMLRQWGKFLGTFPAPPGPPKPTVVQSEKVGEVERTLIRYEAERGLPIEAYILRPSGKAPEGGRPGAVVFHSTDDNTIKQPAGITGTPDKHIGLHLAQRGYVALCPRNFLWEYGAPKQLGKAVDWLRGRHPGVTGMAKMLFDAGRAVDLLAAEPDVNPKQLVSIGHSLGAKEVLYLSAFDERIRATVSSEGGIGLGYSNWEAGWYLGDAIKRPGFPFDHGQILALSAPRAFLLLGGDSADGDWSWPYIEAAMPLWRLLGAPDAVGLLNHKQGHAYPPVAQQLAYRWLDHFLGRS